MLDEHVQEQLLSVFGALTVDITLSLKPSRHDSQEELREMLADVARCSPHIAVAEKGPDEPVPTTEIYVQGKYTGIRFEGVPGGHEFSSLVLAILNAGGQGRMPDAVLRNRTAAIQGPVRLRTFVSLSCTNCPDVVQELNRMALAHEDFRHTIIDGALVPGETARLGIQGVPAVFDGDTLIHSGKADYGTLLEILEARFGSKAFSVPKDKAQDNYDVLVLGGGPAGAASAIYSARKGLKTAVVAQKIGGQVNDTQGITNLVSVPRTEGKLLSADLRTHMKEYGIDVFENRRVEVVHDGTVKTVHASGGEQFSAKALIVATGAKWRELGVPGEREHIGRGVAFCPHCDGPFFAGKRVVVIGGGNSGVEAAIDLAGICSGVTLLEFAPELRADRVLVEAMHRLPNVRVLTSARTMEIIGDGNAVQALKWENRTDGTIEELETDGVFVQIGLVPNSAAVSGLVALNRAGEIEIDARCRTSVPGIYAAGDVTTVPWKQIVIAMGEGAKAALSAFEDRIRQET